jgi:Protein of unknown function (DUF559)
MAAILACGPGALLSHRSAAALWDLLPTSQSSIDVTAAGHRGRRRSGIRVHSARTLGDVDVAELNAIPCASLARTLLDLAEVVTDGQLERAIEQAEILQLFDGRTLDDVLARATGRRGAPRLRTIVDQHDFEAGITASELENRFLALCTRAGLPLPQANQRIALHDGSVKVDFVWHPLRLIVDTDGHRFHGNAAAFERDRRRDQRLAAAGWQVVRFTWRQVVDRPGEVVAVLRELTEQL